jgi:universal stress protein E
MQKILVIADQIDQKQLALEKAIDFAVTTGAGIDLAVFCYDDLSGFSDDEQEILLLQKKIIAHRTNWWRDYLLQLNKPEAGIAVQVIWAKEIYLWVNEHVQAQAYDLLIKTGCRSETLFYTPTDWHLFRESPVPVYCVNDGANKSAKTVLAALDLATTNTDKQALNDKVLEVAFRLAVQSGAELHCCYAISIPTIVKELELVDIAAFSDKQEAKMIAKFEPQRDEYEIPPDNIHIKMGRPHKVIHSIASQIEADFVVIGCVGRKGLQGKLIGNMAEKTIRLLTTDLCVVSH